MASGEIHQRRVTSTAETITEAGLRGSNATWLPAGAVMVALNGQGRTRGSVAILSRAMTCNQSLAAMIPYPQRLRSGFLFLYLETQYQRLRNATGDGGRNGLNLGIIRDFPVPVLPLSEQDRIAGILMGVDDAIAAARAVIDQTRRLKTALLHDLLTHGVPGRHGTFTAARLLGRTPSDWKHGHLGDLARISNGSTPSRANRGYWKGDLPWLPTGKVNDGEITRADEFITGLALRECPLRMLKPGTTLIAMIGQGQTRGKAAYLRIEASINQNFAAVEPGPTLQPRFLYHYLDSQYERLRRSARGSNQDALNCELLRDFPVPVPPWPEQERIAHATDVLAERVRAGEATAERLQAVKSALGQVLLAGWVQVKAGVPWGRT